MRFFLLTLAHTMLLLTAVHTLQKKKRWRNFYRWVGLATTVFNWITLGVVHAMLTGVEIQGLDGPRCALTFNLPSFRLKWIAQFVNQTFQVCVCVGVVVWV